MVFFVYLTGFCGTGFYLLLTPKLLGFWKSHRKSIGSSGVATFIWALSPVPVVFAAAGLVIFVALTRG